MQLINAAKVVDFPEPVGPVHKTTPLCNLAKFIKQNIYGNTIVIGMGAGSISNWLKELSKDI